MSTALSHTRLTKHTSLIHSHTLAYCQDTRSHSMHALAVMHSRTLTHTHHDRVSRVGSGSVVREQCACAVVTTSSLLLLSCGKRPVSALRVLPSPFSLLLRFPLRCRYPSAISCNDQRNHYQSMSSDSFFEEEILHQWCVSEEMRESSTIPAEACDAGSIEPKPGSQLALLRTPHAGQQRLQPLTQTSLLD